METQNLESVSDEDLSTWKQSEVSKSLIFELYDVIERTKDTWAHGGYADPLSDAKARGEIFAYSKILSALGEGKD